MTRQEFEELKLKEELFINEFIELCKKHNLALRSDDPYCGLEIVPFDEEKEYYQEKSSFGRWEYEKIEKNLENNN